MVRPQPGYRDGWRAVLIAAPHTENQVPMPVRRRCLQRRGSLGAAAGKSGEIHKLCPLNVRLTGPDLTWM